MESNSGIKVSPEQLSPEALRGVVEEFVTRDGTNLAECEMKIAQVMAQIHRGDAEVWFDEVTRTCNILMRTDSDDS